MTTGHLYKSSLSDSQIEQVKESGYHKFLPNTTVWISRSSSSGPSVYVEESWFDGNNVVTVNNCGGLLLWSEPHSIDELLLYTKARVDIVTCKIIKLPKISYTMNWAAFENGIVLSEGQLLCALLYEKAIQLGIELSFNPTVDTNILLSRITPNFIMQTEEDAAAFEFYLHQYM